MARPSEIEIFFHVGLGKAASTYIQKAVFPALEGIHYIHRNRYRDYQRIIAKSQDTRFLVSREAALRLEQRVRECADFCPTGKVIFVVRRHDSWLASHFRRYLKNGGQLNFDQYCGMAGEDAVFTPETIYFRPKIEMIERHFGSRPLVLFHETLKQDPYLLVDQIAQFTKSSYRREDIDLTPIHTSYNEKQLKVMRKVAPFVFAKHPKIPANPVVHRIQRRSKLYACYVILGMAKLIPESAVDPSPVVPQDSLKRIREMYADDWQQCLAYAQRHNPPLPSRADADIESSETGVQSAEQSR